MNVTQLETRFIGVHEAYVTKHEVARLLGKSVSWAFLSDDFFGRLLEVRAAHELAQAADASESKEASP